MLASTLTLANISQLKAQYHNVFHMLYSNGSFDFGLCVGPCVVVGAGCLLMLADSIFKLMLASVAHCRGAEEKAFSTGYYGQPRKSNFLKYGTVYSHIGNTKRLINVNCFTFLQMVPLIIPLSHLNEPIAQHGVLAHLNV